jgi:hypothetical protein
MQHHGAADGRRLPLIGKRGSTGDGIEGTLIASLEIEIRKEGSPMRNRDWT